MTLGRFTDWFYIDAITGANPPPDFISSPISIQANENKVLTRVATKRKGEKHKRKKNRFGKPQVRPCEKSIEFVNPVGRFRSIIRFLGRTKVSLDKSFLSVRFNLREKRSERNRFWHWSWFYLDVKLEINFGNKKSKSNISNISSGW